MSSLVARINVRDERGNTLKGSLVRFALAARTSMRTKRQRSYPQEQGPLISSQSLPCLSHSHPIADISIHAVSCFRESSLHAQRYLFRQYDARGVYGNFFSCNVLKNKVTRKTHGRPCNFCFSVSFFCMIKMNQKRAENWLLDAPRIYYIVCMFVQIWQAWGRGVRFTHYVWPMEYAHELKIGEQASCTCTGMLHGPWHGIMCTCRLWSLCSSYHFLDEQGKTDNAILPWTGLQLSKLDMISLLFFSLFLSLTCYCLHVLLFFFLLVLLLGLITPIECLRVLQYLTIATNNGSKSSETQVQKISGSTKQSARKGCVARTIYLMLCVLQCLLM